MVDTTALINTYLNRDDWRVQENSNMKYSLQGLNNHIVTAAHARYWLEEIYPEHVQKAHVTGAFHIHDLGSLSAYCVGWDLLDLIQQGFGGVKAKTESKPPRHFRTALGQLVNFFYTVQGEVAGAVAVSNFDTLLAPFIRYDGLTYREVKQAMQEFIFNINVPTRVGFQTPFTNLTMDLTPPSVLRDSPVIIGGQAQDATYGEFQAEMTWVNRAFAEVMLEGDAKGRVFTFPIPTYNITKDFNWEDEALEPLWRMTAKYGIPYFANFVNSDMNPDDARSMCCRLRLDNRELRKRMGGLFAAAPLTGSVGVVTLNMARLGYEAGYEAQGNRDLFFAQLNQLLSLAYLSLEIKRDVIEAYTEQGLYPYSRHYLKSVYDRTGKYWSNHFSTIGVNGMHECCLNFLGQGIDTPEGKEFILEVMHYIRDEILPIYQETSGNLYNLEATPCEGATYRLAKLDRKYYSDIIAAGSPETPYYTNSTHLPVDYSSDLFVVLDHQDNLQTLYTGGTVLHVFLGEQIDDWRQVRLLVRTIAENYALPYFTLTATFSVCHEHGYLAGEQPTCPYCGAKTEVYSRVVGYLRPVRNWNKGKQTEFRDRQVYKVEG